MSAVPWSELERRGLTRYDGPPAIDWPGAVAPEADYSWEAYVADCAKDPRFPYCSYEEWKFRVAQEADMEGFTDGAQYDTFKALRAQGLDVEAMEWSSRTPGWEARIRIDKANPATFAPLDTPLELWFTDKSGPVGVTFLEKDANIQHHGCSWRCKL